MALIDFLKKKKEDEIIPLMPAEIYATGVLELQDVIAPSALEINSSNIKIGQKVARTIFAMSYPRFLATDWFSPIINLDKFFDVSIFIHPIDTGTILSSLQKKVAEVQSQIHMREEKGLVRDPILDTAYQDLEDLRDKLQQATEKLFSVGIYIMVYADDLEELNKVETEIKSILESKLVYMRPTLFQQLDGLKTVFPFGTDFLEINSKMNSSPVSISFLLICLRTGGFFTASIVTTTVWFCLTVFLLKIIIQ